jgi:CheY-like chemotaxis protein
MTAEVREGDRQACLAAGMDDYVVKPVGLDRLGRALAQCRDAVSRGGATEAFEAIDPDYIVPTDTVGHWIAHHPHDGP